MPSLPADYTERVYAAVLGKIIGVYLGRPFEGWSHERILQELGEVWYYVHERLGVPLVVTDDDISGTFTFLRALADYDGDPDLTPEQIGWTWLNYLIERRTVLWWGGMGTSTEHTAYLRLKHGVMPPASGSIATNGQVVAEQIGAQIFIDGWGLICPGDPARAADFARRAASVSHDGEAIYGAQVIAAMEALAFVEPNIDRLIDAAAALIPADCVIARLIADLRRWRAEQPDWREAFALLAAHYGYDKYGGGCHMVPNHGVILLALLYGDGDFQKSLMIANTCGWDTDCNAGNVGCMLGLLVGLEGLDAGVDWRGPVADRLYLPTADGGRCVTDAAREALEVANLGRALAGEPPLAPKGGARFHFSLPGSVQGWQADPAADSRGTTQLSQAGARGLALAYRGVGPGRPARAATATFIGPEALKMGGYGVIASPTLYPGQTVEATVTADPANGEAVQCRLYLGAYDTTDGLTRIPGDEALLAPGQSWSTTFAVPWTGGFPIAQIGLEVSSERRADGTVYLDRLTWHGTPTVTLTSGPVGGALKRAWVDGADRFESHAWGEPLRLIQDEGTGLVIQGCRDWTDYRATATVTPHMLASGGLAVRVQGMRRYYALLLCGAGRARLVKALEGQSVLAEMACDWQPDQPCQLALEVMGNRVRGWAGETLLCDVVDAERPLLGGAVALVCEEGRLAADGVKVAPAGGGGSP